MKLYRKADGEIVGTQALAGKDHTAIDVPTDKPGLIAWLNENLSWQADPVGDLAAQYERELPPVARLLYEDRPDHMTSQEVDRMFADPTDKPPLARDAVCESIAQYEGADLGYVALEVASRYQSLAKRDDLLS